MQDFDSFLKKNWSELYAIAEANTVYNKEGFAVITKDDPWRKETCWDEIYEKEMRPRLYLYSAQKDQTEIQSVWSFLI